MNTSKKRRRARQLVLTEQAQELPRWRMLPEECRREVVELLAKLLRAEIAADGEDDNE